MSDPSDTLVLQQTTTKDRKQKCKKHTMSEIPLQLLSQM